jgi:fusaric acid resistance family protein
LNEITRLDRSNFSASHGLRAAIVAVAPLVVGIATGNPEFVFATLGAMFVTNTEGPNAARLPLAFLLVACLTEASAFGLGTLASVTGILAVPLLGLGVFIALFAGGDQRAALVGRFTAIFFAVGVGLPGGSAGGAVERFWLSLLGGLLAFLGAWLHQSLTSGKASGPAAGASEAFRSRLKRHTRVPRPSFLALQSESFRNSVAAGAASALGLTIGLALGLPRDFWIVVTIIIALRPRVGPTVNFALMMVIGTVAGAAVAGVITMEIGDVYLLEGLLFAFATGMFAMKGVNLGLSQVFIAPFIIILLNLLYPGEWQLAETRVLDVVIGGAVAILTVYLTKFRFLLHRIREER